MPKSVHIKYPDGTVAIVSSERLAKNPPLNVVNPGEEKHRKATSKHNFLVTVGSEAIKIDAGLFRMQTGDVVEKPEKIMKDTTGKSVKEVTFIKASGQLLPPGTTGKKLVNDAGQDVSGQDVQYYIQTTEGEKLVSPFAQTKDVKLEFKPLGTEQQYIIAKEFEVVPDSDSARWELWKLAKYMSENGKVAVGVMVPKEGWEKFGVILQAFVEDGTFYVIARLVQRKLLIEQKQTIPKEEPKKKGKGEEIKSGAEELFG